MKYVLLFLLIGLNLVNLDAMEPKAKKDKKKKQSNDNTNDNRHVKIKVRHLSVQELPKISMHDLQQPMIDTPGKRKSPNTDECLAKQALPNMLRSSSDTAITYKKSESKEVINQQVPQLTSLERDLSTLNLHDVALILSPRKTNELEKK